MAELQRAGEYVQHLSRMTACTRTRLEYERSMVRMTREQQRVLEQIKLDGDFLVKGGAEELAVELEEFLFGGLVTREEYCEAMIERGAYSNNYSRLMLLEAAATAGGAPAAGSRNGMLDWIFVDEAQDLSSADLAALKLYARRGMILAGDADQSIYRAGFALSRSGIDIRGRTRSSLSCRLQPGSMRQRPNAHASS